MNDLKPCPFCGSKNVLIKGYPIKVVYHGQREYFVICHDCGGQTKRLYGNERKVIELWNRRVGDDNG